MPSCSVKWCKHHPRLMSPNSQISFHRFPKSFERTKAWLATIGMSVETFSKRKKRLICSRHFLPEDFISFNGTGRNLLKVSASPSPKLCSDINENEHNEFDPTFLSPDKSTDEKIEEEDDVFSETDDVKPKRLKTEEYTFENGNHTFENSNHMEFVPDNLIAKSENFDDYDDIDSFMNEITQRIKQLPETLKDVAKVNILSYITELELQQNTE